MSGMKGLRRRRLAFPLFLTRFLARRDKCCLLRQRLPSRKPSSLESTALISYGYFRFPENLKFPKNLLFLCRNLKFAYFLICSPTSAKGATSKRFFFF